MSGSGKTTRANRSRLVAACTLAAAVLAGACSNPAEPEAPKPTTTNATATSGDDPIWVVTQFLNERINKAQVPDYPYVCPAGRTWSPAGIDTPDAPLSLEPDVVLDIRSFDPASMRAAEARNHEYQGVTVRVKGFEREEERNFLLGPLVEEGFCIGDIT